jgi:hypothetical protein
MKYHISLLFVSLSLLLTSCTQPKPSPEKVSLRLQAPIGTQHKQRTAVDTKWKVQNAVDTNSMKMEFVDGMKVASVKGDTLLVDYKIDYLRSEVNVNGQNMVMDSYTSQGMVGMMFGLMTKLQMNLSVGPQYDVYQVSINFDSLGAAMNGVLASMGLDSAKGAVVAKQLGAKIQENMKRDGLGDVFGNYVGLYPDTLVQLHDKWQVTQKQKINQVEREYLQQVQLVALDSSVIQLNTFGVAGEQSFNPQADTLWGQYYVDRKTGFIQEYQVKFVLNEETVRYTGTMSSQKLP